VVENVTQGEVCGGKGGTRRGFVLEKVTLGEVCGGKGGTRRGLWWKR
jgi:hypothetical protein